jgi:thiamine biosynthesis lipoprotein
MRIKHFLTFSVILLLFSSCGGVSEKPVTRTEYALGTFNSVRIHGLGEAEAESALDSAFARLHKIEALASAKNPDSELSYVNMNAYERAVTVSEELYALLHEGRFWSEVTDGAFDITLGAIIELWGIGSESARVPDADELAEAAANSGFEHLVLNEQDRTVRFLKAGLKLDLGSIAKGYAAGEMERVLLENGVTSAIIDLGGDITAIGSKDGADWTIGITDPLKPGEICAKLHVSGKTIVTSGNYERYFMHNGVRYHHIFDRRTGFPADSGFISATIIFGHEGFSGGAMIADALSTALFVSGTVFSNSEYIQYILIGSDMNFTYSECLELEIIN